MSKFFRILCWSLYLGTSWTWCIGMFLPVILVSEFGNAAWFVFAIPNVIGAAAMGWTLSRPGASLQMVANHRTACVSFTVVTLAFHVFFLFWMSHRGSDSHQLFSRCSERGAGARIARSLLDRD